MKLLQSHTLLLRRFQIPMRYGEANSLNLAAKELRAVDNWTPLHYAAWVDHFGLAERLIATDEDVKARTDTGRFSPISPAVANNSSRTLKLLLEALGPGTIGVQGVMSPLHIAACFRSADATRVLIDHAADVNCENQKGVTPFDIAVMNDEVARSIRQMDVPYGPTGDRSVQGIIYRPTNDRQDQIDTVRQLLVTNSIDLNIRDDSGRTLVSRLASQPDYWSDTDLVELLLKPEADPNIPDKHGETPICKAIQMGYMDLLELLLNYKADPNLLDGKGETPLANAIRWGNRDLVQLLLKYEADPKILNSRGQSLLHIAVSNDEYELAKLFANYLDVNQLDNYGNTPIHLAADMHFSLSASSHLKQPSNRMIDMLVEQGAIRTRNIDGALPENHFPTEKKRPLPAPCDPSLGGYRPLTLDDIYRNR